MSNSKMKLIYNEELPHIIDLQTFLLTIESAFNFLCTKFAFELNITKEFLKADCTFKEILNTYPDLQKAFAFATSANEVESIHKFKYINKKRKRIIEIVISSTVCNETYTDCDIEAIYLKRLNENNVEPEYDDYANYFDLHTLAELLYNTPYNLHLGNSIKYRCDTLLLTKKIINGGYWPILEELKDIELNKRGFTSLGKHPAENQKIKEEFSILLDHGYEIIDDELTLPPYEIGGYRSSIRYFNKNKKEIIFIVEDYREQEIYATVNAKLIYKGLPTKKDYLALKHKILNI